MDLNSNDKTPKKLFFGGIATKKTPILTPKNFVSRFNLLANNNGNLTPSPLMKGRVVRNPFENQLHEILHMPVISSPSLFHAPSTPKHNSGKLEVFEWTIEDLSSFNPVNVVPHETQFREETDPEREAQAQAKITSFFSEHQIVPSPKVPHPMRVQKIDLKPDIYNSTALSESNNNAQVSNNCHIISSIIKVCDTNRIMCDNSTQTALSFPPILPKEIEDLLKRFQIEDSSNNKSFNEEDESRSGDRSMMDISTLRRKLFIKQPDSPEFNVSCSDDKFAIHLSPAPDSPQLAKSNNNLKIIEDGNNSISSDMFGELSPISMPERSFDCSSPMSSHLNDISMTSDVARDNQTPSNRRRCNKLKKKNLSESFSILQNEFNEEVFLEEENCDLNLITLPALTERRVFARFDSGFAVGDEDSNSTHLSLSAEFMQV